MPCVRRHSRIYPPPLIPDRTPPPWRATLASRVLTALRKRGESTLSAILSDFDDPADWLSAALALDRLVRDGRVVERLARREGGKNGWAGKIAVYRIAGRS